MDSDSAQGATPMKFVAEIQNQEIHFELAAGNGMLRMTAERTQGPLDLQPINPGVYSLILNHRSHLIAIRYNGELIVQIDGRSAPIILKDEVALQLEAMGWENALDKRAGQILAQIPGLVTQIFHAVGDDVNEGDPLLIMEAMKMENELKAPISGKIQAIHVQPGQSVEKGMVILELV